jgi:hypothetical protein
MREDDRSREKFAEELLDAALPKHRGAEPQDGLEDRVLANLSRQSRAGRPASWNPAPVIIAAVIVLALFAVDHLKSRPAASDPAIAAVSKDNGDNGDNGDDGDDGDDGPRGGGASSAPAPRAMAGEGAGVKIAKAFSASSASRRRDLALNLSFRREDERAAGGLRIEEARISEIRLDDIVIGDNERRE